MSTVSGGASPHNMAPQFWTNRSVLALAGRADPIESVIQHARAVVFRAMEQGWQGPPFDPFRLAEILQVAVVPREDLLDARVVATAEKGFRIEFNPTRPRGRLRFNIAHELAHTFFPDCATAIRYRSSGKLPSDDWQLELVCNVAAAELLMPIGTFTDLATENVNIERVMELRRQYDVSIEALLLRIARLTEAQLAIFAAARTDDRRENSPFRLDYVVGSRTWSPCVAKGDRLPSNTVLGECTAVGYTAKRQEAWPGGGGGAWIEGVGIPPYPGSRFPRVVGLLRPKAARSIHANRINHLFGDATQPRGDGPRVVVHLVNDKTPNWGGPFARAVRKRWPLSQEGFRAWVAEDPAHFVLGRIHVIEVESDLSVMTMVAQKGYGPSKTPRIRYEALRCCLEEVSRVASERGASVHMPRVGAGEAGGNWNVIEEMIDEILVRRGVPVTVYTLPEGRMRIETGTAAAVGA